jgi:hypothetical protein
MACNPLATVAQVTGFDHEKVSDSTGLLYCAAAIYSQPAPADYTADALTVYYQRPPRRR